MTKTISDTNKPEKSAPDWERIELDYRAGIKTLRQIAKENGISHSLIARKVREYGWARDLTAKIHAKADELVTKSIVTKSVTKESKATEREIVDASAEQLVAVRLSHRKDSSKAKSIAMALFAELEAQAGIENAELLSNLSEIIDSGDNDRMMAVFQKIITLPERVKSMKALADSLRVCIDMERQAFGLDTLPSGSLPGGSVPRVTIDFVQPRPIIDDE